MVTYENEKDEELKRGPMKPIKDGAHWRCGHCGMNHPPSVHMCPGKNCKTTRPEPE